MLLFFSLMSYPAEISHSNLPNRELSNDLSDVVVRRRKVALHTISQLKRGEALFPPVHVHLSRSPFLHFRMLLFFSLTSYPAEIAYSNSPNRELSKSVWVMALYWSKIVDPSRSPCLKTVDRSFKRRYFLVLPPVLLKNAYFNWANSQLFINVRPVELR